MRPKGIVLLDLFSREAFVANDLEAADPVARTLDDGKIDDRLSSFAVDDQGIIGDPEVDVPSACIEARYLLGQVGRVLRVVELTGVEPEETLGLGGKREAGNE